MHYVPCTDMYVWNRLLMPAVRKQLGLGYCKSFGAFIHIDVKAMQTLDKPLVSVVLNKEMKFSQIQAWPQNSFIKLSK